MRSTCVRKPLVIFSAIFILRKLKFVQCRKTLIAFAVILILELYILVVAKYSSFVI